MMSCVDRLEASWSHLPISPLDRSRYTEMRGLGYDLKADYPSAIIAFQDALKLVRAVSPNSERAASILGALASAEIKAGDFVAAERNYRQALRIYCAVGSAEGEATHSGNLAGLSLKRENWIEAETLAREALLLSEKVGRLELIASNCQRIAKALVRQGKSAEALPYAQRSVEIYTRLGSPDLKDARAILRECES